MGNNAGKHMLEEELARSCRAQLELQQQMAGLRRENDEKMAMMNQALNERIDMLEKMIGMLQEQMLASNERIKMLEDNFQEMLLMIHRNTEAIAQLQDDIKPMMDSIVANRKAIEDLIPRI